MDTQVMTQAKIIEELNEVLQIDLDAVGAYQTAFDAIDVAEIKNQLLLFQRDHERHITDLEAIILRCGGKPRKGADWRGMVQRGFTKVAGLVGAEGTLKAMLSNEKVTNNVYAKHCQKAFPPDILAVLQRNYGDEQRHFSWIEICLRQRLWEHQPMQPTV